MNDLIEALEEMCLLTDEFAKSDVTPNTPLYNFQQGLIANAKRYRQKKAEEERMIQKQKEEIAFNELKSQIIKLMFDFADKYAARGDDCLYPQVGQIIIDALTACLSEAQYQIKGYPSFTSKQIDHICYQIGDWYLIMKPLLEGQHNLGYMKEKLKIMICGDRDE